MKSPEPVSPSSSSSGDQQQRHGSAGAAERPSETAALRALVERVRGGEVEAAREVRRLTRASAWHRRKLAGAVEPLVAMLRSGAPDGAGEAALLALLNLAVRDERLIHPVNWLVAVATHQGARQRRQVHTTGKEDLLLFFMLHDIGELPLSSRMFVLIK